MIRWGRQRKREKPLFEVREWERCYQVGKEVSSEGI